MAIEAREVIMSTDGLPDLSGVLIDPQKLRKGRRLVVSYDPGLVGPVKETDLTFSLKISRIDRAQTSETETPELRVTAVDQRGREFIFPGASLRAGQHPPFIIRGIVMNPGSR